MFAAGQFKRCFALGIGVLMKQRPLQSVIELLVLTDYRRKGRVYDACHTHAEQIFGGLIHPQHALAII